MDRKAWAVQEKRVRWRRSANSMSMDPEMPSATAPQASPRMYVAIFTVMFGAVMFGLDLGNFSNVQGYPEFLSAWCLGRFGDERSCGLSTGSSNRGNAGWLAFLAWAQTAVPIGAACGTLLLGPRLSGSFGRRGCIFAGSAITTCGALATSYLSFGSVRLYLLGRFVTGFGVGTCNVALPMYTTEIATPAVRGIAGSIMELNALSGLVVANVITYFHHDWRSGMMLPGYAGLIMAVAIWFLPESPRYLLQASKYDSAVSALRQMRTGDVTGELGEIQEQISKDHDAREGFTYSHLLREPSLRRRVMVACGLNVAMQSSGVNVFNDFGIRFFGSAGLRDPFLSNIIFSLAGWLGIFTSLFLIDSRYGGRRALLLWGSAALTALLVLAGVASLFNWRAVIILVLVCAYNFFNELSLQPIPWFYPSEIFTLAERDRAVSLAIVSQYVTQVVIVQLGPYLIDWSKVGMCFCLAAMNLLNWFFFKAYVRETRGVPLERAPALFEDAAALPGLGEAVGKLRESG